MKKIFRSLSFLVGILGILATPWQEGILDNPKSPREVQAKELENDVSIQISLDHETGASLILQGRGKTSTFAAASSRAFAIHKVSLSGELLVRESYRGDRKLGVGCGSVFGAPLDKTISEIRDEIQPNGDREAITIVRIHIPTNPSLFLGPIPVDAQVPTLINNEIQNTIPAQTKSVMQGRGNDVVPNRGQQAQQANQVPISAFEGAIQELILWSEKAEQLGCNELVLTIPRNPNTDSITQQETCKEVLLRVLSEFDKREGNWNILIKNGEGLSSSIAWLRDLIKEVRVARDLPKSKPEIDELDQGLESKNPEQDAGDETNSENPKSQDDKVIEGAGDQEKQKTSQERKDDEDQSSGNEVGQGNASLNRNASDLVDPTENTNQNPNGRKIDGISGKSQIGLLLDVGSLEYDPVEAMKQLRVTDGEQPIVSSILLTIQEIDTEVEKPNEPSHYITKLDHARYLDASLLQSIGFDSGDIGIRYAGSMRTLPRSIGLSRDFVRGLIELMQKQAKPKK